VGIFHLLWSLIVGFVVGLIARAVVPGGDKMGIILTTVLGIVGSLVGGFLGGLVSRPKQGSRFHPAGFVLSIIGAIVVLLLWRFVRS
jgi:uncharacterized membrane protein YeaQ/YmgE (transglycosylase-associated protein family)